MKYPEADDVDDGRDRNLFPRRGFLVRFNLLSADMGLGADWGPSVPGESNGETSLMVLRGDGVATDLPVDVVRLEVIRFTPIFFAHE